MLILKASGRFYRGWQHKLTEIYNIQQWQQHNHVGWYDMEKNRLERATLWLYIIIIWLLEINNCLVLSFLFFMFKPEDVAGPDNPPLVVIQLINVFFSLTKSHPPYFPNQIKMENEAENTTLSGTLTSSLIICSNSRAAHRFLALCTWKCLCLRMDHATSLLCRGSVVCLSTQKSVHIRQVDRAEGLNGAWAQNGLPCAVAPLGAV